MNQITEQAHRVVLEERIRRLPRFGVVGGVIMPAGNGTMIRLDDALIAVDELRAAIQDWACCSKDGQSGRHDQGCWAGCKNAVLALVRER